MTTQGKRNQVIKLIIAGRDRGGRPSEEGVGGQSLRTCFVRSDQAASMRFLLQLDALW
jgi:hypothetical protein